MTENKRPEKVKLVCGHYFEFVCNYIRETVCNFKLNDDNGAIQKEKKGSERFRERLDSGTSSTIFIETKLDYLSISSQ